MNCLFSLLRPYDKNNKKCWYRCLAREIANVSEEKRKVNETCAADAHPSKHEEGFAASILTFTVHTQAGGNNYRIQSNHHNNNHKHNDHSNSHGDVMIYLGLPSYTEYRTLIMLLSLKLSRLPDPSPFPFSFSLPSTFDMSVYKFIHAVYVYSSLLL